MCTCANHKPAEVDPLTGLVKLCTLVVIAHQGYQLLNGAVPTASSMTVVNNTRTDETARMLQLLGMLRS